MHILFLTDNFPPESNAPANRTFEHAREWVKAGYQVTVITCAPNFPAGKVFDGYRNKLWQSEEIAGIRVIRVWTYMTRNEGFALRILDYLSFMVMAFFAALPVRKVDVIVGTSPQFFTACAAWAAAALKRRPFVFELRDIWPESIRAVSAMKESRLLDLLEWIELFLYRRAAVVVSVTHSFVDNLVSRGIPREKVKVVTNGADMSSFSPRPKDAALLAELNLEDKFVAGYVGTLGMAHGLDTLLDAAKRLATSPKTRDVRLLILGDGAERDHLESRIRNEGIDNVLLLGRVPRDEVIRYWSILDIAIVHLRRSDLFKSVIPSKLFECMALGIPVLHGVEGESADIVNQTGIGFSIEPENPDSLASAISGLMNEPDRLVAFREAGPKAAQEYDRAVLAARMADVFQDVVIG